MRTIITTAVITAITTAVTTTLTTTLTTTTRVLMQNRNTIPCYYICPFMISNKFNYIVENVHIVGCQAITTKTTTGTKKVLLTITTTTTTQTSRGLIKKYGRNKQR